MSRRTALALAACLLAAACSDDPEPVGTSATRTAAPAAEVSASQPGRPEPQQSAAPSGAAPAVFAANTELDEQAASGGPLAVTAVRVARQPGYDRVVFELDGRKPGAPGWRIEYVDNPTRDGSGEPLDVAGDATLAIRIEGAGYPEDAGAEYADSATVPADVRVVEDVVLGAVFEGVYEAWIGTSRKAPFRVFRLEDPARVVVDIRHD